ncbi:hypothetical protein SISSUDRAFT_1127504 [Sistotremastrum suecicum HHB10207 ss-3]|uniref:Uncharacterized protein n=1 Tax=Sistotremastrum suecicum HHB10207 ss-3 TaxID=1314776 RepID=A0A166EXN7_9AGAM|nr:hypothetical protein SISSUDRAFT_1127504 [Sistotremastrum suecicum HHB10207 ss-3]
MFSEFSPQRHSTSSFALLSVAGASALRLSSFPQDVVAAVRAAIIKSPGIRAFKQDLQQSLCEITINEKLWSHPTQLATQRVLVAVFAVLLSHKFKFISAIDYGREPDETLSLAFSRPNDFELDQEPPLFPFALSFNSITSLRVIGAPLHSTPAILNSVRGAWPRGVAAENKLAAESCYEFKLEGYHWFKQDTFPQDSLAHIYGLLGAFDAHGFSLAASLSISGTHSHIKDLWIFTGIDHTSPRSSPAASQRQPLSATSSITRSLSPSNPTTAIPLGVPEEYHSTNESEHPSRNVLHRKHHDPANMVPQPAPEPPKEADEYYQAQIHEPVRRQQAALPQDEVDEYSRMPVPVPAPALEHQHVDGSETQMPVPAQPAEEQPPQSDSYPILLPTPRVIYATPARTGVRAEVMPNRDAAVVPGPVATEPGLDPEYRDSVGTTATNATEASTDVPIAWTGNNHETFSNVREPIPTVIEADEPSFDASQAWRDPNQGRNNDISPASENVPQPTDAYATAPPAWYGTSPESQIGTHPTPMSRDSTPFFPGAWAGTPTPRERGPPQWDSQPSPPEDSPAWVMVNVAPPEETGPAFPEPSIHPGPPPQLATSIPDDLQPDMSEKVLENPLHDPEHKVDAHRASPLSEATSIPGPLTPPPDSPPASAPPSETHGSEESHDNSGNVTNGGQDLAPPPESEHKRKRSLFSRKKLQVDWHRK